MEQPRDHEVTRSEEELVLGTVWEPAERVRLSRRVVALEVTVTVTVQREELYVEREPVSRLDEPGGGDSTVDEDIIIVLREERPVVDVEVVPYELVRVGRRLVDAGEELVSESLRKEVIEIDGVEERRP